MSFASPVFQGFGQVFGGSGILGALAGFAFGGVEGGLGALFGGNQGGTPSQPLLPPTPTPAPVPTAPDRSAADIQASADRARRAYGIFGGRVNNALTGGVGVPTSQTYGAITQLVGGVGR